MARPHIFGIGEGKSGSSSLNAALRILGFRSAHTGQRESEGLRMLLADNSRSGVELLSGIDDLEALVEMHEYVAELDEQVDDAKFILTYRPPDDAALSWCRMLSERHEQFPRCWASFESFAAKVRRHIDRVVTRFYGRPERLLILDARDDDAVKWRLLGTFLGVPVPDCPYPRAFDHSDWQYR